MTNAEQRRYVEAERLAYHLTRHLEVPCTATADGRVIVYATSKRGEEAQAALAEYFRARRALRTVKQVPTAESRLCLLEVSGAR